MASPWPAPDWHFKVPELSTKTLVNAVVDSYMTEVVNPDNDKKKKKYDEAERICGEKEQQARTKREELKSLVGNAAGGADPELVGVKLKMILEELCLSQRRNIV